MGTVFFPENLYFAWAFCLVLVGLTAVACYTDLRTMKIPKPLTLTALILGLLFNVIRGGWLGVIGKEAWVMGPQSFWLGGLDGLLFALAGFGVGFGMFLVMWLLGACGGGDVKLFAALGAWLGPVLVLYVLMVSVVLVIALATLRLVAGFFSSGLRPTVRDYSMQGAAGKKNGKTGGPGTVRTRRRLMAYSLPAALSTALVLLWVFRVELHLAPAPAGNSQNSHASAQP